jgi:DNA invertase Pin-like site-specific DNA recombinase
VGVNVGYARCSTTSQDLTAQREQLAALGVPADRVYLDKGLDQQWNGQWR